MIVLGACAVAPADPVSPANPAASVSSDDRDANIAPPEDETLSAHGESPRADPAAPTSGRIGDDLPPAQNDEPPAPPPKHPLAGLSDAELLEALKQDPDAVGSLSIGQPNAGALYGGVKLPDDPRWVVVDPSHAYGTRETVSYIRAAVEMVVERFPDSPQVHIGHISAKRGGHLRPHRSHQSGRDVDLGYYYKDGSEWYARATASSLDVERTWAFVRALVTQTDVYFILMDHSVQALLEAHALAIGEDAAWVSDLFRGTKGKRPALMRHVAGHATHMHVRFYNPVAEESARRCYSHLVDLRLVTPPTHYVRHKVKKGDTLIGLAKRYGTTVSAIKRANGLRSNKIIARKQYKIPRKGPAPTPSLGAVPPRRMPPDGSARQQLSSQEP